MYHSILITVRNKELCSYFDNLCKCYNNMINTTNYHIRQCMSGIQKPEKDRFPNEIAVISKIEAALPLMNAPKCKKDGKPKKMRKATKTANAKKKETSLTLPTSDKWFKGYKFWDSFFKVTKNADYRSLPGQVNQQAIKDVIESWSGYFEALKSFKANPKVFNGLPNIPKYRKPGTCATTTLSNQICKIKKSDNGSFLIFPKTKLKLNLGNAEFLKYKLMETKVKPSAGYFDVILTLDDGIEPPTASKKSERIIGIDLGVNNIAAISNNFGLGPMIIKGSVIKSYNQWFNKKNAAIQSEIDKHTDTNLNGVTPVQQRENLFVYRKRFYRDIFGKISKYIIEYCKENKVDTIVIGKSNKWKLQSNTGRVNNQMFCSIPHNTLVSYIQYRAEQSGIKVIISEESYTSKASFLDGDIIPAYGVDGSKTNFSGKRQKRGLYVSKNGTVINADINGASNIIRKVFPDAFKSITDLSYLYKTVISKQYHDFTVLPHYKYSA